MARRGNISTSMDLKVRFYNNGTLFNPYSIDDVVVYDARIGGTSQATITPTNVSTGVYSAIWDSPTAAGTYYDEWTWTALEGMSSKVQRYSFSIGPTIQPPSSAVRTGPLFIGSQEVDFFNSIGKELIQKIIAQKIIYYSVSEEHTKSHRLYDEAIKKTVFRPVEMNALVLFNEPLQSVSQFTIDTIYSIEVYFHVHELEERNLIPREGDFVKFGEILYEIEKLNKPQIVYGQVGNKVMVKAICRVSRKSQFEVLDNF